MLNGFLTGLAGPLHRGYNTYYGSQRVINYGRYRRVVEGFVPKNTGSTLQWKKLQYNPVLPILNINAEFLAGKPIRLQVDGDERLTNEANGIWDRAGGAYAFMENVTLGMKYGDSVLIPYYDERRKKWTIKWVDPSIAFPVFDPNDYDKIMKIDFVWADHNSVGDLTAWFREEWANGVITRYNGGEVVGTRIGTYDENIFNGCPIAWIKPEGEKGRPFGISLVDPLVELVEKYDHLMQKQDQMIDYYANPNLAFKGVKKTDNVDTGMRKVYFLPSDGDVKFIEWSGSPPGVEEHIRRIKDMMSEVSSTPAIAFSNFEFKFADVSGVALKVLFGPLLLKTDKARLSWGKGITRAVRMALYYETGQLVEEDQITILWQNPLPNNTKEDWEIATIKNMLGVSWDQIQREQGYTQDQIEQMIITYKEQKEREAEYAGMLAEETAKSQPAMPGKLPSVKEKVDQIGEVTPGKILEDPAN